VRRGRLGSDVGGFAGAGLVLVAAAAAPEVGVALLTVALVSASTGVSPVLTMVAVVVSVRGQRDAAARYP
jgi:hypothetical protein